MKALQEYTAIILASGRGSRLGTITDNRPKCLVELAGRSLLEWQINALQCAGLGNIVVTTGYRNHAIEELGVDTIHNPHWDTTNMVGSLICAMEELSPPFIVSYADIVYASDHVSRLLEAPADLAVTYDTDWIDLWERRFNNPLEDAETFLIDDEHFISEIGGKTNTLEKVQGQFMGLLKISPAAANWITQIIHRKPEFRSTLDTTGLLQMLLIEGHRIYGVPVAGRWCEIDNQYDLHVAEELARQGRFKSESKRKE